MNAWYFHSKIARRKMDMLHFRDAIIDGMIEQNEQNHGEEVLPTIERKMPTHRHHLEKQEGQARNSRKICRSCYENIQKEERSVTARKKAKRVTTYCENCEGKPAMCLDCFNKKHF